MMLSSQSDLPENIVAIIEDSGYKSAKDYLSLKLKQRFHLPSFPIIPIVNIAIKVRAGYWLYDASAIDGVSKSKVPIMFIHGTADKTVPVSDVYELYEVATCTKEIYIVDGAGHGESMYIDPLQYWHRIDAFLDSVKVTYNN